MTIQPLDIADVKLITPKKFGDHRGFFAETYSRKTLAAAGVDVAFVQDNHSLSATPGTVRALHFQLPPFAQDKLVRVLRGSILDVAVDIRRGSATFGKFVTATLTAEGMQMFFVPSASPTASSRSSRTPRWPTRSRMITPPPTSAASAGTTRRSASPGAWPRPRRR